MRRTRLILFLAIASSSAAAQSDADRALRSLADAERAFAQTTVKEGFRDGFIKFFAEDGIGFSPHPQRTKEVLSKQPPATGPRTLIFNWAPMLGDISAAGDLGYTTGPVLFTPQGANAKPPWHGMYFSVWQKQSDGSWKVVVDMGVDTPQAVAPIETGFSRAGRSNVIAPERSKALGGPDYLIVDRELSDAIAKNGVVRGYLQFLADGFRFHRNGIMPVTTKEGLASYFQTTGKTFAYETIGGKVAVSADLAFTYGSVSEASTVVGYYVHVWQKDKKARWRLVADVLNGLERN